MKTKGKSKKASQSPYKISEGAAVLRDAVAAPKAQDESMVRTQIYLSRREHEFIEHEAARQGQPMAAVIRSFIDEKMDVPSDVWSDNPLLRPPVPDPAWAGAEDGAINHDHYLYGAPKKWMQRKGKWVETPPLPDDYYTDPKSRQTYDNEVNRRT